MANIHVPHTHLKYYKRLDPFVHFNALKTNPPENLTRKDLENVMCGFHLYNEKNFISTALQKMDNVLKVCDYKKLMFLYVDVFSYRKVGEFHTWNASFGTREYKIVMERFWETTYYHIYDVSYIKPVHYIGTAHNHMYLLSIQRATPCEMFVEKDTLENICGCETVQIELDIECHPISVASPYITPRDNA